MTFLLKALLAATALIPVATAAQDSPQREGRWRGNRGGGEAKIEARNEARGIEAQQSQERPQRTWSSDRGPRVSARAELAAERRQPRLEQRRWNSRDEERLGTVAQQPNVTVRQDVPSRSDLRADRSPDTRRAGDRQDLNGQRQARRDDRRGDDRQAASFPSRNDRGRDVRNSWNQPGSDNRYRDNGRNQFDRGNRYGNNGWNQPGLENRYGNNGWNQPGRNDRFQDGGNWSRTWRNDRRYDWNGYRASNRYVYRLPRYYAPSGWSSGYRRFSVGVALNRSLWGENYWIGDPYSYRLPDVYGPYRWVRYYDDALLVDIRTGRVVDMVNGIFW